MSKYSSMRRRAPRLSSLAACLAVALVPGGVGAFDRGLNGSAIAESTGILSHFGFGNPTAVQRNPVRSPDVRQWRQPSRRSAQMGPHRPSATITVDNCNDDGPGSLRQAVADAEEADTILLTGLTCSTITLTSGSLKLNYEYITLKGPGADMLTISGSHTDRVLEGVWGLTVDGLTIANGKAPLNAAGNSGGGCINSPGYLELVNSKVTGCRVDEDGDHIWGVGVRTSGYLYMENSSITNNEGSARVSARGGGVFVTRSAYIKDSIISGNRLEVGDGAEYVIGGGLYARNGTEIENSEISGNEIRHNATDSSAADGIIVGGAGIGFPEPWYDVVLDGVVITGNHAIARSGVVCGGGLWTEVGDRYELRVYDSVIADNSAVTEGTEGLAGGGGICTESSVSLIDSIVSGNWTDGGDGLAVGGGMLTGEYSYLINSTVSGNTSRSSGGIALGGGVQSAAFLVAMSSQVHDNSVSSDGGLALGGGLGSLTGGVYLLDSIVRGNTAHSEDASSSGAGVMAGSHFGPNYYGGIVYVAGSTITGNMATSNCDDCTISGGGVYSDGYVVSGNSEVSDNHALARESSEAHAQGGGISALTVFGAVHSTISGNTAIGGAEGSGIGGGVATGGNDDQNQSVLIGTTVAHNHASTAGGGLYITEFDTDYPVRMISTIIAGNTASSAADIGVDAQTTAAQPEGSNNLVLAAGSNVILPADTLMVDPLLLPLENNGGPTRTHALDRCSPAIDQGIDPDLEWDQRGEPYGRLYGAAVDIGAFELQPAGGMHVIFGNGFEPQPDPCP